MPERNRRDESGGELAAVIFERNGRHGYHDVVGQQGGEGLDVPGLMSPH
ncbi:MAG TPA: hypothetical protein VGD71_36490 [Kribbella sp.]